MKIKFCGAAESVTGSSHLITSYTGGKEVKILLDCGELQGDKSVEAMNSEPFPFEPAEVDFVILSHAHIDHCGRLPLLHKRGFEGKIFCTDVTADLLSVMLRDSAHIWEMEAEPKTRRALRAGRPPVEPLYTVHDAEETLKHVIPVMYDELVNVDGIRFVLNDAGHIIGSAITELWIEEAGKTSKIVFTGDLGQHGRPIIKDPTFIKSADYVIMESTYGNRRMEKKDDQIKKLADVFAETAERGGTIIIPVFAIGRAQDMIYALDRMISGDSYYERKLKGMKVYVDSPMAIAATEIFKRNVHVFDDEYKKRLIAGDDPLYFFNLIFTKTAEESKALNSKKDPKIIISTSGMCESGRVRHHLKHHLWQHRDSICFVGYQSAGTLGREILDGAESVRLFGEDVNVNAHVYNLPGFSAHADHDGLMAWVKGFQMKPSALFLVHGDLDAKQALAADIEKETGIHPTIVERVSEFELLESGSGCVSDVMGDIARDSDALQFGERLASVRETLGVILDKVKDRAHGDITSENFINMNNRLLSIEKNTMGIATDMVLDEEKANTVSAEHSK